ncbi:MAG: hypothetical protein R6U57_09710 [Anaerolineales bacterium]
MFSGLMETLNRGLVNLRLFWRIFRLNQQVKAHSHPSEDKKPVIFFNASTRLWGLNLNAAFAMLASWAVQLSGRQVYHFGCASGMSQCVLGAGLGDPKDPPPCQDCMAYTRRFTGAAPTVWFTYQEDPDLRQQLEGKSIPELKEVTVHGRPLGRLVLPSLRWILRRHHLEDNQVTHYLFREFILSAHNVAEKFYDFLEDVDPEVVVVFNGLQYPEAAVRTVAEQKGVRVITHEVNLQPFSAFFTEGQATIYPLNIPEDFQLTKQQNQRLDRYLQKRFQGDFTMAGIKFWSSMTRLPDNFLNFAGQFEDLVPVFTNVIFDTSQVHANTIFPHMFAWLDAVLDIAKGHPHILFVIRAHPDEMRKGKESQESVAAWAEDHQVDAMPNVLFVPSQETISSYELIHRSKFTMVYNSSIGLEAALLDVPVLCAGKARYTQYPTVFYPSNREEYEALLLSFLKDEDIKVPQEYVENARRFLYYQLYKASLPFGEFLRDHPTPGYVQLRKFSWKSLHPHNSDVMDVVVNGILHGEEFVMEDDLT